MKLLAWKDRIRVALSSESRKIFIGDVPNQNMCKYGNNITRINSSGLFLATIYNQSDVVSERTEFNDPHNRSFSETSQYH